MVCRLAQGRRALPPPRHRRTRLCQCQRCRPGRAAAASWGRGSAGLAAAGNHPVRPRSPDTAHFGRFGWRCQSADASLLMLEMLVLGRAAMGEQVRTLDPFRPAQGPARRAAGAGRPGAADIGQSGRPSGSAGATPRHRHSGTGVAGGSAAAGPGAGAAGGIGWR